MTYDVHLNKIVCPPENKDAVRESVGDGRMKVARRCSSASSRHVARPVKVKTIRKRTKRANKSAEVTTPDTKSNGCCMVRDLRSQRVPCESQTKSQESNAITTVALKEMLHLHKEADTFGLNKSCQYAPTASGLESLLQIKLCQ